MMRFVSYCIAVPPGSDLCSGDLGRGTDLFNFSSFKHVKRHHPRDFIQENVSTYSENPSWWSLRSWAAWLYLIITMGILCSRPLWVYMHEQYVCVSASIHLLRQASPSCQWNVFNEATCSSQGGKKTPPRLFPSSHSLSLCLSLPPLQFVL